MYVGYRSGGMTADLASGWGWSGRTGGMEGRAFGGAVGWWWDGAQSVGRVGKCGGKRVLCGLAVWRSGGRADGEKKCGCGKLKFRVMPSMQPHLFSLHLPHHQPTKPPAHIKPHISRSHLPTHPTHCALHPTTNRQPHQTHCPLHPARPAQRTALYTPPRTARPAKRTALYIPPVLPDHPQPDAASCCHAPRPIPDIHFTRSPVLHPQTAFSLIPCQKSRRPCPRSACLTSNTRARNIPKFRPEECTD